MESVEIGRPKAVVTEEESLAWAAREGDVEAFERLYHLYAGRTYALCLRMSGDAAAAEELTQETFVRAWQSLGEFRGEAAFTSWLHRIAISVALGNRRTEKRREVREDAFGAARAPECRKAAGNPGVRLDIEAAIAALPDRARAVFVLHDIEGYTHREIAEAAGIGEGASRIQLHRARKMLREVLR